MTSKASKLDMPKGFGAKQIKYILEVAHVAKIPFLVAWEGTLKKTDSRAINTGGLIWGLLVNGTDELHRQVAEKLDPASADAILELYQENQGQQMIGNLKAQTDSGRWVRLVEYASHEGLRRNLKQYEALDFAAAL